MRHSLLSRHAARRRATSHRSLAPARTLVAVVLAAAVLLPSVPAQVARAADVTRVRIGVTQDGLTAVTPADLAAAGVDPATVDPRTFALSSLGEPVAVEVTGEEDGRFDPADRIVFFGEKFRGPEMDQKYTDERVYWLDIGGAPGPRVGTQGATPEYDRTPPADFATTVRAEESNIIWTLHSIYMDTEDTWFWARLQSLTPGQAVTATLPTTVPHPAPGAAATLRLEEISRAYVWNVNPDHRTTAALNGVPVLDEGWDGLRIRKVFSAPVPAGVLSHGTNTLAVGAWVAPGVNADDVMVNYWELDYRRLFRAFEGRLDFRAETAGIQEYSTAGWPASDVLIWDVTDPNAAVRLVAGSPVERQRLFLPLISGGAGGVAASGSASGAGPSSAADVPVRFRVLAGAGDRFWLQAGDALNRPASVRLRPPTGLRNPPGGADSVIVTSAELLPQAERLAGWHRDHGRRALVVDIQDAYDEFNHGLYHPKAVPAMLAWASTHWEGAAPAYLTLLGDGHWNFKGYNPALYPPSPNHVPPYLAFEDPWQGEVPADARYGDLDGDKLPDLAIGRLAARTPDEARVLVDKILAYDETVRAADWQRRAVFVADNPDASGDFHLVSDEIVAGLTPADLAVTRVYLPGSAVVPPSADQVAATRVDLVTALQAGAFMVQYTGHGAINHWTHESIWTTADVPGLTNGSQLPLVMTFNCLDGYFAHADPSLQGMAETMNRQEGGGSIAAFSPTGLGITADQHAFRKILLTVMFTEDVRELGPALLIAKQRFALTYGAHYMTQTMSLFGEPALALPISENQ